MIAFAKSFSKCPAVCKSMRHGNISNLMIRLQKFTHRPIDPEICQISPVIHLNIPGKNPGQIRGENPKRLATSSKEISSR